MAKLRLYFLFVETQYGIKIPLEDYAFSRSTERLSDHLRPFLHVQGHGLKSKLTDDPELTAVVNESGLDASQFAMAFPNLEAVYQDLYKYSYSEVPAIPSELEDFAFEVMVELFQKAMPGQDFRPDSFHEALGYVNRETSPGFPENMKYKNKAAWLDDNSIDHESIVKRYATTGVCVGQCSFKEEVRPLEKLEQEKARSFVSGNIVENICWLIYAGPFFRAMAASWRDSPVTYGISELHRGWHYLLERIGKWLGFKTDMKQCDGTLDLFLQRLVARVWKFFIADESPGPGWPKAHEAIDRMTEANCKMWMRLPTGVLFLKKQGNGSGGGATIQFNSCGQLAIVIMWLKQQGLTKEEILSQFEFQCHGDDGRFAASPEYLKYLDFPKMNAWWKSLGRLYHYEVEGGPAPSDLSRLPWLSRMTTVVGGTYVPHPKEPAKLLASAVLRNRIPDDVHPKAYVRSRWWQLTNQMVNVPQEYSPINFDKMVELGEQYEKVCLEKDKTLVNNVSWRVAGHNRKMKRWLQLQHISTEKNPRLNDKTWEQQGKIAPRKRVPLYKTLLLALAACSCLAVPVQTGDVNSVTLHGTSLNIMKPCEKSLEMTKNGLKPKEKKLVKKVVAATKKIGKKKVKKVLTNQIRGKGDFFSNLWKKGKTMLGQGLHKGIDFLSGRAKDAVGHLVGSGDYQLSGEEIKSNSLYSGASMVPTFANSAQHGTIVCHRESLGVFASSTGYNLTAITLNPGLAQFPWASRIAGAWQRYKVHGAIIEWIPRVPEISTNAGGSVVLSARYDLTTAAPRSIVEAEIGFGAITARPMDKMAMPIECKNSMNPTNVLNVRFGASLPTGANAQFFDHCIIDVSIAGQASSGTVIGEVFITYDIEFMMPTAEHVQNSGVQTLVATSSVATATPYGVVWYVRANSNLSATFAIGASLSIDFDDSAPLPVGSTWLVTYSHQLVGGNVTTNATTSLGADLTSYTPVFRNSAGANIAFCGTGVPAVNEATLFAFQVVGSTGTQQLIFSNVVFGAGATGYSTITLTPILSTLSLEERMMRHRFPKLYEMEDLLSEVRLSRSKDYARTRAEANTCEAWDRVEDPCDFAWRTGVNPQLLPPGHRCHGDEDKKVAEDQDEESDDEARAEFEEWILHRRRTKALSRARIAGSHPKRVEPGANHDEVLSLSDEESVNRKKL